MHVKRTRNRDAKYGCRVKEHVLWNNNMPSTSSLGVFLDGIHKPNRLIEKVYLVMSLCLLLLTRNRDSIPYTCIVRYGLKNFLAKEDRVYSIQIRRKKTKHKRNSTTILIHYVLIIFHEVGFHKNLGQYNRNRNPFIQRGKK